MPTQLKVFNLGKELDASSVYADYATPKLQLVNVLGNARTTIYDWCDLAWFVSDEYRMETPQLEDGSFDTSEPLSPYQVWLISRIKVMMQRLKKQQRVKAYIKSNSHLFSKARFNYISEIIQEKIGS